MARPPASLRPAALALAGWTLFTWTTRVPLLLSDSSLSVADKALGTLPVLVFVALGLATAVAVLRRAALAPTLAVALAGWSLAYWAVRLPLILLGDHPAAFLLVHAVLAGVAGALSIWVLVRRPTARSRVGGTSRASGAPVGSGSRR